MKSDIKKLPKSLVEITITVPYEMYKEAEKEAIQEISKEIKVDGFRAGHMSEDVVRKHAGDDAIGGVTLEKLIPKSYADVVKENDIHVIAQPKIDLKTPVKKEGDELVYTATVPVMPEVKVGNYKKIKVVRPKVKVEKKQIEETIQMISDRFAEWKDVKRKAKNDDRVEITFEGFDEKKQAIPNTASKNHPVILGSKTMIPGFEEAVIGMEVGDDKEFDITFPKDYHAENMKGKKVKFKLSLGRLEEKKVQELNEALIEKITGKKQNIDEFKKHVEEDLQKEMENRSQQGHDSKVVQEIIKITTADLPDALINDEVQQMKKEQEARVKQQGMTWEQYLQHIKKTEEDFAKDHQKAAEDRLLARLGVHHILKDAKIEIPDAEVDKKIDELMKNYPQEQQEKVREYYKKGGEGYRMLKNNLSADKLIETLTK